MGEVYRAHDERLERDVALKVLPAGTLADEQARKRFRKEALALSKLNHPHIATVHDFDTQDGTDFLVMELVEGVTLNDKLAAGALPEKEITRLGAQLAEGLAAAHERRIVHRDLKPANLRVTPDGRLKILDFGLAKLVRPDVASATATTESFTETQAAAGTLPYMAPEQLRGEQVDARTDIHALGAVLYEMATGQRAFPETQGPRLIDSILHQAPVSPSSLNPRVPSALESIILKALDKDPERRYQSAKELLVDLERLSASTPVMGAAPSPAAVARRWWLTAKSGRRNLALSTFTIAAALTVSLLVYFARPTFAFKEKDWIFVTDVKNETGDPIFDEALKEAISIDMGQSKWIRVFSPQMTRNMLQYMHQASVESIDEKLGMAICQRASVKAMLIPSIRPVGQTFQLSARLLEIPSGRQIVAARIMARSKEEILEKGVDELVGSIRKELGESLASIEQTDLPIDEITTSSWEALRQFALGKAKLLDFKLEQAKSHLENAVQLDPSFVFALTNLGIITAYYGDREGAIRYHTSAMEHIANVSEKEKLTTRAIYHLQVENNAQKAVEDLEALLHFYPGLPQTFNNLAVIYREYLGDYEKSLHYAKQAVELDPFSMIYYNAVSMAANASGHFDEAIAYCSNQIEMNPEHSWAYFSLASSYSGKREYDLALAAVQEGLNLDRSHNFLLFLEADLRRLMKDYAGSMEVLDRIEKANLGPVEAAYQKAILYTLMGKTEAANASFDRFSLLVEESVRDESALRRWKVRLLSWKGKHQEALKKAQEMASSNEGIDFYTLAKVCAINHEAEKAILWIRKAQEMNYPRASYLSRDIDLDPIRSDPGFQKFLEEQEKSTWRARLQNLWNKVTSLWKG